MASLLSVALSSLLVAAVVAQDPAPTAESSPATTTKVPSRKQPKLPPREIVLCGARDGAPPGEFGLGDGGVALAPGVRTPCSVKTSCARSASS